MKTLDNRNLLDNNRTIEIVAAFHMKNTNLPQVIT